VLSHPSFEEFDQVVGEFKPTVIYLGAPANFDLNKETGTLEPFCFKGNDSGLFIVHSVPMELVEHSCGVFYRWHDRGQHNRDFLLWKRRRDSVCRRTC